MHEYHKIKSVFKRDDNTHYFLEGSWSVPEFNYLKDNEWVFTEKIDGTNVRIIWNPEASDNKLKFMGKTKNAQMQVSLYDKLNSLFTYDKFQTLYPDIPMCLYGEGYGVKIQTGGKYIPDGVNFILFDCFIDKLWLRRDSIENIAEKLEISVVPIVGRGTINDAVNLVKNGLTSTFGNFQAEGLVLRPCTELRDRRGNRIITKLKHKDFNL